jgi:transcriptional regulator with XRE-family HTH domain
MRRPSTRAARVGRRRADRLADLFGGELRIARDNAGLTQRQVAEIAGLSQPFVSLVERGQRQPEWRTACSLAAAVAHDLSIRLFPTSPISLRDSGQLKLASRILEEAHESWHGHLEYPVSLSGTDRRAADMVLEGPQQILHIEIERRLVDLQAQLRAAQLKRGALATRLDRPVRLIITVPDTRAARHTVASAATAFRTALPGRSAAVWRSIRTGAELGSDGLLFVPVRQRMTGQS